LRSIQLRITSIALLCVLAGLAASSVAQGSAKKIKLSATVTSLARVKGGEKGKKLPLATLKEGSKTVGKLAIHQVSGASRWTTYKGTIKLSVGTLKGTHKVAFVFEESGSCPECGRPVIGEPAKFGKGTVSTKSKEETIVVRGSGIPAKLGARFVMVLEP
jgi:hypothetical protein